MTNEKKPPQSVAGITLCAAVDVMEDRLEVAVCAFGPGVQPQAFCHRVIIFGDPAQDGVWQHLWLVLQSPVRNPDAGLLGITAVGIDAGGHHTPRVFQFVHEQSQLAPAASPRLVALKGMSTRADLGGCKSMSVDANIRGNLLKNCLELLFVRTKDDRTDLDLSDYAQAVYDWVASDCGLCPALLPDAEQAPV